MGTAYGTIFPVRSFGITFQETIAAELNRRFADLVLGIPHPAVNTRDVALYQPFRNALRSPNQLVRLPTLTFHLMGRRCQEGQQNPVRYPSNAERAGTYVCIGGFVIVAPTSWKMRARLWTCTARMPTNGRMQFVRANGHRRCRPARFRAATCETVKRLCAFEWALLIFF